PQSPACAPQASKSEDKGLSFFKSALRQKETRRSADLGKTAILAKKAVERTAKSNSQCKLDVDDGEGSGNSSQQISPEPRSCKATATSTPNKRSLLPVGKSKSSNSETSLQSHPPKSFLPACNPLHGQHRRLNEI
ncbi:hypothetical protein M9458_005710, partial [Cirrhinus mrigala]